MRCPVLIVEDDPELRTMMDMLLSIDGFAPTTACDGREALDVLRRGVAPHVIVLDLMMPVMDGWTFREALRADPDFARIPIVVVSALTSPNVAAMHPAAVLQKPVDVDALLTVVRANC